MFVGGKVIVNFVLGFVENFVNDFYGLWFNLYLDSWFGVEIIVLLVFISGWLLENEVYLELLRVDDVFLIIFFVLSRIDG